MLLQENEGGVIWLISLLQQVLKGPPKKPDHLSALGVETPFKKVQLPSIEKFTI